MALANRVDSDPFDCALNLSGDGGRTWVPASPVPELPEGADECYGPEISFDRNGVLYYMFVGLHGNGNTPMGVFITTSTNRQKFSSPRQVLGPDRFMARMVIDQRMGKLGRIHLVWLETGAPPALGGFPSVRNPIMAAYSDDGGRSFSTPTEVADPSRRFVVAPSVALGRDGAVHVAYYDLENDARDYLGLEGPAWDGTWTVVVATSLDRGKTFTRQSVAATALVPPERVMLIFTMAPPAIVADGKGGVWTSWWDARNGDWDVFLAGSRDGAGSFGAPLRLNDDPQGNGRHQYLPRLSVAPGGRIDAIFYDRREDASNQSNEVSYTFSTDGGRSFAPNVRITSEAFSSATGARYFVPSAKNLIEFGSRLALVPTERGVLAAWTDTRNVRVGNTHQDIFATEILFGRATHGGPVKGWWTFCALGAAASACAIIALVGRRRRRNRQVN